MAGISWANPCLPLQVEIHGCCRGRKRGWSNSDGASQPVLDEITGKSRFFVGAKWIGDDELAEADVSTVQ